MDFRLLNDLIDETVPENMDASKETPFSESEVKAAIASLKNGSCPGQDGIPVEFYKMFWRSISSLLIPVIEDTYQKGLLHDTARQGILNLIPKGREGP